MSIEQVKHKWLRPYLVDLSSSLDNRWDYWARTIEAGKILDEPIPKINFTCTPSSDAIKNLDDCIGRMASKGYSNSFDYFVDWLLYGFGDSEVKELPSQISDDINDYWYRTFDLSLFYLDKKEQKTFAETGIKPKIHGFDYLGYYASTGMGKGKWWNPTAFFATPAHVVEMMVEMIVGDDKDKFKGESFIEPCCGSGIFLLHMSNYCLNMHGIDISNHMVKLAKVNMWAYVPWVAWVPDKKIEGFSYGQPSHEISAEIKEKIKLVEKQATLGDFFRDPGQLYDIKKMNENPDTADFCPDSCLGGAK